MRVAEGVLDLRHIQQGDEFTVRMNGEWEFYFSTFIYGTPGEISDSLHPDCYGRVPGYWNEYTVDGRQAAALWLRNIQGPYPASIGIP
ncbi:MAG: hypothetical protein MZV63_27810 [Marinilabiliales bacterium]|nr:hypothetical protein [Marinilabiliales bacterium]